MRYSFSVIRWMLFIAAIIFASSCKEDDMLDANSKHGYVQFHLSKKEVAASRGQLDYLNDICKIRVELLSEEGLNLSQTLKVSSYNSQTAEYGMQSEKWMLAVGNYKITGYEVYDQLDNSLQVYSYDEQSRQSVNVTAGGLTLQPIQLNVLLRGKVKFRLVKDNADPKPELKVNGVKKYPFFRIVLADVKVKCLDDNAETEFKQIPMTYKTIMEENRYTGVCTSDTLFSLPAGRYRVISFKTFFDKNQPALAESNSTLPDNEFTVTDNTNTTADVPVTLDEAADYIKDAYVLYKIWLALDGPNWSYKGPAYSRGANWEFENRDIDMWTAQPGVQIHKNGRVAVLDLEGFGAKGDMPAELGQLTELRSLLMGTHLFEPTYGSSRFQSGYPSYPAIVSESDIQERNQQLRKSLIERFTATQEPYHYFAENLIPEDRNIDLFKASSTTVKTSASIKTRSNDPKSYATLITSLPPEIGNLKKLESLYIAYSPIKTLPDEIANCELLSDCEFVNCPELEGLPKGVANLPRLTSMGFGGNSKISSDAMIKGLQDLNRYGSKIQVLIMPDQKLEYLPDLTNLKRLNLLNVQNCGIKRIEKAFGKEHYMNKFIARGNEISTLPVDNNGYFLGLHSDFELLDLSYNQLTEVPNVFSGNSNYAISTVDLSFNKIAGLQGANDGTWRGINAGIMVLAYNKLKEFPEKLYTDDDNCSQCSYLQLQGNNMEKISDTALNGKHAYKLVSLDLSKNKLTNLPPAFNADTYPYLYGIDLSYNSFAKFMYRPLNCPGLTVYNFVGQRDSNGNRCMKEWPSGVGQHKGLRMLILSSNDIRKVTDLTLSYMIWTLDISDNPNIWIDVTSVCPYIKAGRYRLVYDKSQDICGCDVLFD